MIIHTLFVLALTEERNVVVVLNDGLIASVPSAA